MYVFSILQDHEGNQWRAQVVRNSRCLTVSFDKAVHHFTNNRTRIAVWSAILLSRDPDRASDIAVKGNPVVGYFNNFIDEPGFMLSFPIEMTEVFFVLKRRFLPVLNARAQRSWRRRLWHRPRTPSSSPSPSSPSPSPSQRRVSLGTI